MSITERVHEIMSLASAAKVKDEELRRKHGLELGITLGDPATAAYLEESSETIKPLDEYLDTLDSGSLEYLITLMYAGRDHGKSNDFPGFDEFHKSIMSLGFKGNRKECTTKIREKVLNLNHYYSNALELAAVSGFDIDGSFK